MSSRLLLVAGAVDYDYLIYPMPSPAQHHVPTSADFSDDVAQLVIRTAGADLVAKLLASAAPRHGLHVLPPSLQPPTSNSLKHNASAIVDLSCADHRHRAQQHYTVVRLRRIGIPPIWHAPPLDNAISTVGSTVIVSGSGDAFHNVEPALDFLQKARPRYIVHHMTRPLAIGRLWDLIRDGPRTRDGVPDPDFLAVIIDADDLRAEGIALSQSLSWEQTAEDFVRNLGSNGRLDTLVTCPNLIVRFGTAGLIHHRGRDAVDPKLYYHPREMECERRSNQTSEMVGLASAFTAGFALGFADSKPPSSDKALRLGIAAARTLSMTGFIQSSVDQAPDYPIARIMDKLTLDKQYASVSIPSARISSGDKWTIFDAVTGDPAEVARQIVTVGPNKALASCPIQQFGDLLTVERSEQESLRAIIDAVQERLRSATLQPTSIGIIGPAGSGKKFTASNVAKHISADAPINQLSYNARLLKREDLVAACHTIRDSTASGVFTVVSFENFEAIVESSSDMLNDFLVIMRDGEFTDRGHVHSLGAPMMIFLVNHEGGVLSAGSPRPTTPTPITPVATSDFGLMRRAIDDSILLDYLHGVVHITGPNQQSPRDKMFPVRRALMLRQLLHQKHPHLASPATGTMHIDDSVLHALLLVPTYKHGLRSLEKVISTSRLSGRRKFDVAALPPEEQVQLHVDGKIFMSYLRAPKLPPALRERLAEGLFETYKKRRTEMARDSAEERKALADDRSMRDWEDLAPELKESTRAQADDIPRKLRAVGCFMLDIGTSGGVERSDPLIRVPEFSEADLDVLAEMEHERFNAERLQRQWRMGPRNSKQRTTPFLVPWRDLTQEWRDVDRVMVECVPRILARAGWRIYRMRGREEEEEEGREEEEGVREEDVRGGPRR